MLTDPPSRRRRRPCSVAVVAALAVLAVLAVTALAGCSSSSGAADPRSTSDDVAFTGCDRAACTGEIDGAAYAIRLPAKWNGALLLYSHGYRNPRPAPPDFAPVQSTAQVAATAEVADALLAKGYALAGSAYRSNGWAVADGVAAGERLHDRFAGQVGRPVRTYLWGDSLGGLITETLAEKHPEWVDGVAPMCGVLGGANLNFDLVLDVAFAVRTLIWPQLKITGYRSYDDAVRTYQTLTTKILAAAADIKVGVPKLLVTAALADPPTQSSRYDGSTPAAKVGAAVESLLTGLAFGTFGRWEVEQRVGGNPSGNAGVDYAARVTAGERALIETVAPGATDRYLGALARAPRVGADPAARSRFDALGNPTGVLRDPTITLHTAADPLVLVQNESVFADRVQKASSRTADLVQLYTVGPARYTSPPSYGVGHCVFTTAERVGTVTLLDDWVRRGVYPTGAAVRAAFGADPGLQPAYRPGPWPAARR